ncbi:MAG: sirohydrochlorin cobaltochelatase [Dysosmobacter welbionis]
MLFGHGTDHFANVMYAHPDGVPNQSREDVLVGTVEGWPAYERCPLSSEQAEKDPPGTADAGGQGPCPQHMAGPEDSWRTRLEAEGYRLRCEMQGLGQLQGVQEMYCAIWSRCCGGRQMAFEHYIRSGQKWLRRVYHRHLRRPGAAGATPFSSDRVPSTDRGAGHLRAWRWGPLSGGPEGGLRLLRGGKRRRRGLT